MLAGHLPEVNYGVSQGISNSKKSRVNYDCHKNKS